MATKILEVTDLKTHFVRKRSVVRAVDGVSFYVNENETLGIVGESGCGKTMTCLSILRLVPQPKNHIISGKILFKGRDILTLSEKELRKLRGREISMILQDPMTSLNPVFDVGDQIAEAIVTHAEHEKENLTGKVVEILNWVRIPSPEVRIKDYPHQMSGGMRQRVVGAIAISCRPQLLIADEPTTSLDVTIQAQYLQLLKDIQRELGMALIFITHDFGIVARMCDRVCVMYAGKMVESAPVRDIFYEPAHWYTAALIGGVPKLGTKMDRLVSIPGFPPRLDRLPAGCRFSPRCINAKDRCIHDEPSQVVMGEDHHVSCWYPREQ
jgi:oligopeptide/dipeptide ABC transporter ATP-binding protein